jgi:hypothetical protein
MDDAGFGDVSGLAMVWTSPANEARGLLVDGGHSTMGREARGQPFEKIRTIE